MFKLLTHCAAFRADKKQIKRRRLPVQLQHFTGHVIFKNNSITALKWNSYRLGNNGKIIRSPSSVNKKIWQSGREMSPANVMQPPCISNQPGYCDGRNHRGSQRPNIMLGQDAAEFSGPELLCDRQMSCVSLTEAPKMKWMKMCRFKNIWSATY